MTKALEAKAKAETNVDALWQELLVQIDKSATKGLFSLRFPIPKNLIGGAVPSNFVSRLGNLGYDAEPILSRRPWTTSLGVGVYVRWPYELKGIS